MSVVVGGRGGVGGAGELFHGFLSVAHLQEVVQALGQEATDVICKVDCNCPQGSVSGKEIPEGRRGDDNCVSHYFDHVIVM